LQPSLDHNRFSEVIMQIDPKLQAANRLKYLLEVVRILPANQLADALGKSAKAIYLWKNNGLDLANARQIARLLEIDVNFFLDPEPVWQERGLAAYQLHRQPGTDPHTRISVSGATTLMLAAFIAENSTAIDKSHVRITALGRAPNQYCGTLLHASVEGYRRSIMVANGPSFGGINAVLEKCRIEKVDFVLADESVEIGGFPCVSDANLSTKGQSALSVLDGARRPLALIHYCARIPDQRSFGLLFETLCSYRHHFEICAYGLDATKAFAGHFAKNRSDALTMQAWLHEFITAFTAVDDAKDAVSYAIESLAFCAHPAWDQRDRARRLLEQVTAGAKGFSHATPDMRLAALVAKKYLPFVSNPEGFSDAPPRCRNQASDGLPCGPAA
jgi:hypothetical protein